jgi:hypothetical protein
MARRPTRGKSRIITVDFSKAEDRKLVDEGEYAVKVVSVEEKEGDKAPYLAWQLEVLDEGKFEGTTLYNNTSLSDQSLWNLRQMMECMGFEVKKKATDIDLDEMIDAELGVVVTHEDYQGSARSRVSDYFELEEEAAAPAPKEKVTRATRRTRGRDGAANGEEPEKPARATRATRRGGKKDKLEAMDSADVAEMNESELEDIVEKYNLDVDLEESKTLRRKANAVIDALETANMLA